MRFSARYEILLKVASGAVETAVGRDKGNNEKVIIHMLEYVNKTNSEPTINQVLGTLSGLAPGPAGPAIDAGMFDGTSFAYLVTKWTGEENLAAWVRAYQVERSELDVSAGQNSSTA